MFASCCLRGALRSAMFLVLVALALPTSLATELDSGYGKTEPFFHESFVRDAKIIRNRDGKVVQIGNIVANDLQYADDLDNLNVGAIDVVMNQCFSGGFKNDIQGLLAGKNYTFASSTSFDLVSRTNEALPKPPPPQYTRWVDNFTRAWKQAALSDNQAGMLGYFQDASINNHNANIPKDPFAPPTAFPPLTEYPQYASPDPAVGPPFNDNRVLGDAPNDGPKQYAVLVEWNVPSSRHTINLLRQKELLNDLGVPDDRIAILFNNPNPAKIGPFAVAIGPIDPLGLPEAAVSASNSKESWLKALNGDFFAQKYAATDKLYVYNTGHGGHNAEVKMKQNREAAGLKSDLEILAPIENGFDITLDTSLGETKEADDSYTTTNADLFDQLQLNFREVIPSDVTLQINGQSLGLIADLLVAPEEAVPLEPYVTDPTFAYQFFVPHSLLGLNPIETSVKLLGVDLEFDPGIVAVDFQGGEQEWLVVQVPEPATWILAVIAGLAVGALRGRSSRPSRS